MTNADRALAVALLRRDWHWRTSVPLLAGAAALASLCTRAATRTTAGSAPTNADGSLLSLTTDALLPWLGAHLGALGAASAALLVIHRLTSDAEDDWLPTLVAGGASRTTYLGTTTGSAVGLVLAALLTGTAAAIGSGEHGATAIHRLPGAIALILACAAYGSAVAVLARGHGRSLILATLAFTLPLGILAGTYLRLGTWPPWWVTRLLGIHLPLLTLRGDLAAVSYQVAYVAVVTGLVLPLAERRVARER